MWGDSESALKMHIFDIYYSCLHFTEILKLKDFKKFLGE